MNRLGAVTLQAVFGASFVGSAVLASRAPPGYLAFLLIPVSIGALFDLLSIALYAAASVSSERSFAATLVNRSDTSGLPGIAVPFYTWAWIAYPLPVLRTGDDSSWTSKLPDLLVVLAAHFLLHATCSLLLESARQRTAAGSRTAGESAK